MPTLLEAIDLYLLVDRAPSTNHVYANTLTLIARSIGADRDIRLISYMDLLDHFSRRKELSQATLSSYARLLKGFFKWCVKTGMLTVSPADALNIRPGEKTQEDRSMPATVLKDVLEYSKDDAFSFALILFFADTGARVGGVAGMRVDKLDLAEQHADIPRKGGGTYRVWFSESTANALKRWLVMRPKTKSPEVFVRRDGSPYNANALGMKVRRLTQNVCGIMYGPHSIRHAVGHALAYRHVPPSLTAKKLGHRNVMTTLNFYYPNDEDALKALSETIPLAALGSEEVDSSRILRVDFRRKS